MEIEAVTMVHKKVQAHDSGERKKKYQLSSAKGKKVNAITTFTLLALDDASLVACACWRRRRREKRFNLP